MKEKRIEIENEMVQKLESWDDFLKKVEELKQYRTYLKNNVDGTNIVISPYLFRGQEDANWNLKTTLERHIDHKFCMQEYYGLINRVNPKIEAFTGKRFNLKSRTEYAEWLSKITFLDLSEFPGYEYMVYLRHHGFPSPLLDWSESPFIAAYFAFANAELKKSENVAIYVYLEHLGKGKIYVEGNPRVESLGPYVKAHKRHFLQRSHYTICVTIKNNTRYYCCHENVFSKTDSFADKLWKFIIPTKERLKAMQYLYEHNISDYSLFGSEESLVKTLAFSEIDLDFRERKEAVAVQ